MIDFNAMLQSVESLPVSALLNLASDYRTFLRALDSNLAVEQLTRVMDSPEVRERVCKRVRELSVEEAIPDYEHPHDAALAIYLRLLERTDEGLARCAAESVEQCPECWWAKKLAAQILAASRSKGMS